MKLIITRLAVFGAVAIAAAVGAGPAAAAPVLQISQTSGVAAGQTISVTVNGLAADLGSVAVGQCRAQVAGPADCNLPGTLLGKADEQGTWRPNGGSSAITLLGSVGGVDCTAAAGACIIAVTSLTDPGNILLATPLAFG
ncbi:neocarzinostatin apoprotein domain-containing protein [Nocardia sp. NPDC046473]|uniref:neocarzinostatin apoprotein domain-containing protein n=1 Tax=Nocardia sp. NPDC046473 TaxID=3155733 RepID=UPI00340CAE1F